MIKSLSLGFIWFILSLIISVSNDSISKYLSNSFSCHQVAFWRSLFSLITLIPLLFRYKVSTKYLKTHILRGAMLAVAMSCWNYGIKFVPVTTITLISFTIPIFVLILAQFFLHEKVSKNLWFATAIGIVGVIISLAYNSMDNITLTSLIFLVAAFIFASLDILNKKLLNLKETPYALIFYSSLFSTLFTSHSLLDFNFNFYYKDFILLFTLGLGGNIMLYFIISAFKSTKASLLAPLRYLEIVFSSIAGYIFFHEKINIQTALGALLIIFSSLLVIREK